MECHRLGELVDYRYLFLIVVEAEKSKPRYWQIHFLMKFLLLVYRQPPSYYVPTQALLYTQGEKEGEMGEGGGLSGPYPSSYRPSFLSGLLSHNLI